jgi:RNA polymerase sigma factor (sigma-70 family)
VATRTEDLLRELAPQVLAVLVRRYGDFDAAEDATQEALLAAHQHWTDEPPEHPLGWLVQTGSRRMLDLYRSETARRDREARVARAEPPSYDVVDRDDSLTLLFMACHPVLTPASAIALTLRAVGGLTTAEIAHAFLVPEATMAQRISRAKSSIRDAGARFTPSTEAERAERLPAVLRVLYLVFNEGYAATSGPDLQRVELSAEAIRLARLLHDLVPDDGEAAALLALMLLVHARRAARTDGRGQIVTLAEQDRTLWDRKQVEEGRTLLDSTMGRGVGEYRLQASIAALHDRAEHAEDTDWPQILGLYDLLEGVTGNPVVTLNRAVATAMVHGPDAGLVVVDQAAARLPADHQRVLVVRAHLLEQRGDTAEARAAFRRAADLATSRPERERLLLLAAEKDHPQ